MQLPPSLAHTAQDSSMRGSDWEVTSATTLQIKSLPPVDPTMKIGDQRH